MGPSWDFVTGGAAGGGGATGQEAPPTLLVRIVPRHGVYGRVTLSCPSVPLPKSERPTRSLISSTAGACHLSEDSCQHLVQLPPQTQ